MKDPSKETSLNMSNQDMLNQTSDMLINFFNNCQIPKYSSYFDEWRHSQIKEEKSLDCTIDDMCYRHMYSNQFKNAPVCQEDLTQMGISNEILHASCPLDAEKFDQLEQLCQNPDQTKARIVHTLDYGYEGFETLLNIPEELLQDESFSIILFVRDPRAIIAGLQRQLTQVGYTVEGIQENCQQWRTFLQLKKDKNIKARINILRYEDFANDAEYQFKEFFNYLGIQNVSSEMEELIFQMQHGGQPRLEENKNSWLHPNTTDKWAFNTIQHGSLMANQWSRKFTWKRVKIIQDLCQDVMQEFGYRIFDNHEDYFALRSYVEDNVLNFTWDMDESKLATQKLYGLRQRQKMKKDIEFAQNFVNKIYGWDDKVSDYL